MAPLSLTLSRSLVGMTWVFSPNHFVNIDNINKIFLWIIGTVYKLSNKN